MTGTERMGQTGLLRESPGRDRLPPSSVTTGEYLPMIAGRVDGHRSGSRIGGAWDRRDGLVAGAAE
jgi:hypothetical protein